MNAHVVMILARAKVTRDDDAADRACIVPLWSITLTKEHTMYSPAAALGDSCTTKGTWVGGCRPCGLSPDAPASS